jgi:nucleotide-binding universal stress UspA family protein
VTTIVIGFDGHTGGRDALFLGRRFGAMLRAQIVVVCACPGAPLSSRVGARDFSGSSRAEARRLLDGARLALGRSARAIFAALPGTSAARVLHEVAEAENAALIVVGTSRHYSGPLTEGVTWQTLHHAPCAVAVAPRGHSLRDRPLRRIGIACDSDDEATAGVHAAIALTGTAHAPVEEIQVIHVTGAGAAPAPVDEARAGLAALGPVRRVELRGDPAEELVRQSSGLDLLVMGSHDRGPLRRLLLGSVSADVVARAECPVLVRSSRRPERRVLPGAAAALL